MKITFDQDFGFIHRHEIRAGYQEIITKFKPDIWATITFHGNIKQYKSSKFKVRKFFQMFNIYAKKQIIENRIKMLVCFDKHRVREWGNIIHVHLFIKDINPKLSGMIEEIASRKLGDTKAEPYNQELKASFYVANKYATPQFIEFEPLTINPKPYNPNFKRQELSPVSTSKNPS